MSDPEPYSEEWHREREKRHQEWKEKLLSRWEKRIGQLSQGNVPDRARWNSPTQIADVISRTARPEDQSHAWLNLPDSGDIEIHRASEHEEDGCVLLETDASGGAGMLLRPEYLELNLPGGNRRLGYFWLETQSLAPSGVYDNYDDRIREEVCELRPGDYRRRGVYDQNGTRNPDGSIKPLPPTSRLVNRYFRGSFLISCKASPYIQNAPVGKPSPDNGLHADMGPDEFRQFMARLSEKV